MELHYFVQSDTQRTKYQCESAYRTVVYKNSNILILGFFYEAAWIYMSRGVKLPN